MEQRSTPEPSTDPDALLTIAVTASMYGVLPGTVRKWLHTGDPRLPRPVRYGRGFTRFRRRDVLAKLEALAADNVTYLRRR